MELLIGKNSLWEEVLRGGLRVVIGVYMILVLSLQLAWGEPNENHSPQQPEEQAVTAAMPRLFPC
jgi:hypothetical protein